MLHQDWNPVVFHGKSTHTRKTNTRKTKIKSTTKPNTNNKIKLTTKPPSLTLRKALIKGRNEKKLSQKDLALQLNIKQNIITAYENGTLKPGNRILEKLQRILGIKLTGNDIGSKYQKVYKRNKNKNKNKTKH